MSTKTFGNPTSLEQIRQLMAHQLDVFDSIRIAAADAGIDLMADRRRRYLTRWKEALVYVPEKASLLDIGPGWMAPELYQLLIEKCHLDYHALDIDAGNIQAVSDRAALDGLPASNFACGEITALPFQKKFDMVFSSHCLEHAINIVQTLKEIRRVLKDGALLFMSVPLGFDTSDEHLLFHGPSEWISMLAAVGFDVVTSTVGNIYVGTSDLTILASQSDSNECNEVLANDIARRFSKANQTFIGCRSGEFAYLTGEIGVGEHTILDGVGSKCAVTLKSVPRSLVVVRHPWSGCIRLFDGSSEIALDCYHHLHWMQGIDLTGFRESFTVEVVGRNPLARGAQCAIGGVLVGGPLSTLAQ
jgi:2-polyprenyl-3-methyl-5-hydroxy-6-metoxy-1,4-benzoquinol methylase